jgi:predicted  nucleic acid-binding Zn-ribbon protein
METNETEIWKSRATAHEENYNQMLKRIDELVVENKLWKAEAKRWRDMYMQFDEMLESDIKDATKKVSDIIAQVERLSKEMDKGY